MSVARSLLVEMLDLIEHDPDIAARVRRMLVVERVDAPAESERLYFTIAEAAQEFSVSRRTVFEWVSAGMPSVKRGRVRRIPVAAATAWLAERKDGTP